MASVRIEDEARKDPRFVLLGKRLGTTKFDALARMVELWAYCTQNQTYFMREEMIDICAEFDGFAKLIESDEIGLAKRNDNGLIRIKGTKGRIEWLKELRNNSKKGGEKTKARWQAKRLAKTKPEGRPDEGPLSLTLTPSLVLSPSLSLKKEKEEINTEEQAPPVGDAPSKDSASRELIAAYCEAYKARYGTNPVIDGKSAGIAKALVGKKGGLSLERAKELATTYLAMNDQWFLTRGHDLATFRDSLNKIAVKHDTGRVVTRKQAEQAEMQDANTSVARAYLASLGAE